MRNSVVSHPPSFKLCYALLAALAVLWLGRGTRASAQLPFINAGPDSGFAQVDFAQMYLDQINRHAEKTAKQKAEDQELIASGTVSKFDLEAPNNAVEQFNRASSLLKVQKSKEAIRFLQKAIQDDPKFVSAHVALGRAYLDLDDKARAKSEFETAAGVDSKFAVAYLDLGRLAMSSNDFPSAQSEIEKAVALHPRDVKILATLAYAQNGNRQYAQTLATVQLIHTLDHKAFANVHYLAASAAMAMKDYATMERELKIFLVEDPTSEFAPTARNNLAILERNDKILAERAAGPAPALATVRPTPTSFPNTERLKAQLSGLGNESDCSDCSVTEVNGAVLKTKSLAAAGVPAGMWMIRTSVDDVAIFFSVSSHGHMINDLQRSDIRIRDNNKSPASIVQFSPQSKLPLRLGLLIDTSGSVNDRFSFEKTAAAKFVEKVLNHGSDLAFVAGFSTETEVMQDFIADPAELGKGIHKLTNGGGTALFDAVSYACRKLADYPDDERVARVLVIVSDGEDNSSHRSLKQSIDTAERGGVTIYTISTKEDHSDKTDADKVLEALAERTGGEALFPGDVLTLGKSFDKLRDLIRSRYFIAYKPADFRPDGSYRTISIIAEKNGKKLQVRARKGYHSRLETSPN
ncbi:MAG TPA: VWA domain-containing protein [Candidatus Aquilonibacter sp.]|nr:VWA domain-containing protein [Candidatus Aquilonibacter sp.]